MAPLRSRRVGRCIVVARPLLSLLYEPSSRKHPSRTRVVLSTCLLSYGVHVQLLVTKRRWMRMKEPCKVPAILTSRFSSDPFSNVSCDDPKTTVQLIRWPAPLLFFCSCFHSYLLLCLFLSLKSWRQGNAALAKAMSINAQLLRTERNAAILWNVAPVHNFVHL